MGVQDNGGSRKWGFKIMGISYNGGLRYMMGFQITGIGDNRGSIY